MHVQYRANGKGGARLKALGGYTTMIGQQATTEGQTHTGADTKSEPST